MIGGISGGMHAMGAPGYTNPTQSQIGFTGHHAHAYVIQNRYRSYKSISAAEARVKMVREAGWSPPEPEVVEYLDTSLRGRVGYFFNEPNSSRPAFFMALFMLVVIVSSCATFVIETTPDVQGRHANLFWNIEASCVVVFTVEFGSRLLCCPSVGAFAVDKLNWIDFASIVPFYMEELLPSSSDLRTLAVFRLVRLARVFRLLKLGKHSAGLKIFAGTFKTSIRPMTTLLMFIMCGVIIIAAVMYFVERGSFACPCSMPAKLRQESVECADIPCEPNSDTGAWKVETGRLSAEPGVWVASSFQSIPGTFYFALVTMTTVGYGDIKPASPFGMLCTSCFCVFGVILIALPISVISANFKNEFFAQEEEQQIADAQFDERTLREVESLHRMSHECEHSIKSLMDMYGDEDHEAFQRARQGLHTSLDNWMPLPWVDHVQRLSVKHRRAQAALRASNAGAMRRGLRRLSLTIMGPDRGPKAETAEATRTRPTRALTAALPGSVTRAEDEDRTRASAPP